MNLPHEDYKKLIEISPICTVDVLFFDKSRSKTLLFKRTNKPYAGEYFSIGGRMLKNEIFEEVAVRQAKRELNLDIDRSKLIFGSVINEIHPDSIFEDTNYHTVNIFFGYIWSESLEKSMQFDSQHTDHKWFKINDPTLHNIVKSKINSLKDKI